MSQVPVIRKHYAWSWREDRRCWLYAADVRTLADLAHRPKRLRAIGLKGGSARTLRKELVYLRRRDRLMRPMDQAGLPVLLLLSADGSLEECYLAADSWKDVSARLTGGAR